MSTPKEKRENPEQEEYLQFRSQKERMTIPFTIREIELKATRTMFWSTLPSPLIVFAQKRTKKIGFVRGSRFDRFFPSFFDFACTTQSDRKSCCNFFFYLVHFFLFSLSRHRGKKLTRKKGFAMHHYLCHDADPVCCAAAKREKRRARLPWTVILYIIKKGSQGKMIC